LSRSLFSFSIIFMELPTQIDPALKRKVLFRGIFIGGLGALWLFVTGIFVPVSLLSKWGVAIFFLGIGLIHLGLTPYRKLNRLELSPRHIQISKESVCYKENGHPLFSIPLRIIQQIRFVKKKRIYGIAILLKKPMQEKILIHHPRFPMKKFHEKSLYRYRCDFFLPYFSKKTFDQITRLSLPGQCRACE